MTGQKHFKQLVRARMEKTGERYASARRHIIGQSSTIVSQPFQSVRSCGNVPATTALRALLAHHQVRAPHSQEPFTEAMLFGIAGGIGIGVFSFYYAREDVATFFLGARHHWYSDQRYLEDAAQRLGIAAIVQEAGGARAGAEQLRVALERYGPCIAWVDMAGLPHRASPWGEQGHAYHVITVYAVDAQAGTALIGDLADEPITIALEDLARARARIKKDRHRLLRFDTPGPLPALRVLVCAGVQACYEGLVNPALPAAGANARLEALRVWATRMGGATAKESWEQTYRPGRNLLRGLMSIHEYIEHYGTGGGLGRALFADFLSEAAVALKHPPLASLAERYAALGRDWSALADAALPDDVGMLGEVKALLVRKAELYHSGASAVELRAVWEHLSAIEEQAGEGFPLSDGACRDLRLRLRERIAALYEDEVAAHAALLPALPA